jgi:SAM-dependent methyltransferase
LSEGWQLLELTNGAWKRGMTDPYPNKLRVWDGLKPTLRTGSTIPVASERLYPYLPGSADWAGDLFAQEALISTGSQREGAEPYTLQWFLDVENARHNRYGKWIPRLLEFTKHGGERLLGLGYGLGTDWVQYARHGAEVIACSPSADHVALIQRNFELRGLRGRIVHAQPAKLPVETASIDVVCINNLLHDLEQPRAVVEEVFRVLKPGGKVLALTPTRYDVEFWVRCFYFWRWRRPRTTLFGPSAICFTRSRLRRLFDKFVEHRVSKRHLRRGDVPHLWRVVPLGVLERILGRMLILKAFKPLSAARSLQAAA